MVLLLVARNSVLFLVGWELMALAAFFLVATEDAHADVRHAAWVYLVATHIGTAALLAMFALLRQPAGSFDWAPVVPGQLAAGQVALILLLALAGFGMKAGLMPLHVWLPSAHSAAPSHVSAVMSGVMIKMGIYGLITVTAMLPATHVWWGLLIMALGGICAVIAAAAALAQHDLKRMLAYSSIENIGLIAIGLGLAVAGRSLHQPTWILLGLGGALLHVLNHSLFKSLLFFGAGSLQHATATRRMDLMGGLAQAMPLTLTAWMVGALAVSAVPGFNGLPGEFSLYLGLFDAVGAEQPLVALIATGCIGAVALTGALALASVVRAVGAIFLGAPRAARTQAPHESLGPITAVPLILAALCVISALLPDVMAAPLGRMAEQWSGIKAPEASFTAALLPLRALGWLALAVLASTAAGMYWLSLPAKTAVPAGGPPGTWDCGYANPSSGRIQYTSSSFVALLAGLFAWIAPPRRALPAGLGLFPVPWTFATVPADRLLANLIIPFCQRMAERFAKVRIVQQGVLHFYLLYIVGALVLAIAWAVLSPWGLG
jgi:formate hydrogenlyase subunit 3/multisubunit Na+/H+ antiporter MnhD subunit